MCFGGEIIMHEMPKLFAENVRYNPRLGIV